MAQKEIKLKPTEIYDVLDVKHFNVVIQDKYDKDAMNEGGKWLMFIHKSKLDEQWEKCCKLYDEGLLEGVYDLKCSTNCKRPNETKPDPEGVIRFYCGPASDEAKIKNIGRTILKYVRYETTRGMMVFKSDEQTKTGTRLTGQKCNHIYKIPLPKLSTGLEEQMEKLSLWRRSKKEEHIVRRLPSNSRIHPSRSSINTDLFSPDFPNPN